MSAHRPNTEKAKAEGYMEALAATFANEDLGLLEGSGGKVFIATVVTLARPAKGNAWGHITQVTCFVGSR